MSRVGFHVAAFTGALNSAVYVQVPALADQILTIGPSGGFLLQQDMQVNWSFAAAAALARARLITPTWRAIQIPQIEPIQAVLATPTDPNVMDARAVPLKGAGLEELTLEVAQSAAGATQAYGLVALSRGLRPVPPGPMFPMLFACSGTTTAQVWSDITITPETQPQEGIYSVIGGSCFSATGKGFRLITDDEPWRPGGLCNVARGDRAPQFQYAGGMGEWCRFRNTAIPRLQVLTNAAETPSFLVLQCVRTSSTIL